MKKIISIIIVFICSLNFFVGTSYALTQNNYNLEKVTLGLLHPSIVTALKSHYGGLPNFKMKKLLKSFQSNYQLMRNMIHPLKQQVGRMK